MAVLSYGDNNIKMSDLRTTLGETSWNLSNIIKSNNWNKWSFYRGKKIRANSTTQLVELFDDGGPYRLGDARRYDHNSEEPDAAYGGTLNIGGPGSYTYNTDMRMQNLNVKELEYNDSVTPGVYSAIIIDAYGSSSNRASETSRKYRWVFDTLFDTITPPVNHSVDLMGITQYPQLIQSLALSGISSSDAGSTLYLTTSLGEKTGTNTGVIGVRLDNPYSELYLNQLSLPRVTGGTLVGEAGDYRTLHRLSSGAACAPNVTTDLAVGSSTNIFSYCTPWKDGSGLGDKYLTCTGTVEIQLWKNGTKIETLYSGSLTGTDKFVTTTADTDYGDSFEIRHELISGSWVENNC